MRVAVTGASGFVGSHVVAWLTDAGHEVISLGRGPDGEQTRLDESGSGRPVADLLADVDGLVHLAARSVDSLDTPLQAYVEPNVLLTERLLRAAGSSGVDVVVFASTRLVYPSTLGEPAGEDCPHPPDTFYGLSKLTAEHLVQLYAGRCGFRGISLRLAQVVGPGDGGRGALPRMIERVRSGEPLEVQGAGLAVRDFVHVLDVARAIEAALCTTTTERTFNIGGGEGHTVADLAQVVAEEAGLDPGGVVHAEGRTEDTSVYVLDCERAHHRLGWTPRHDLRSMVQEGLAR